MAAIQSTQSCPRCKRALPATTDYFGPSQLKRGTGYCRECQNTVNREWHRSDAGRRHAHAMKLKRFYNLTLEQYDAMLEKQGGVCGICGKPETMVLRNNVSMLTVDHDHVTGQIRGLLCHRCNRGIGLFRDDPEHLRTAAAWLERTAGT